MGFTSQLSRQLSLQGSRSGGEPLKPKYYLYVLRFFVIMGTATSVALLVIAWTRPINLHSLSLRLDRVHPEPSCPSLNIIRTDGSSVSSPVIKREGPTPAMVLAEELQKRGVALLHAWTDSELFLRAVTEEKKIGEQNTSIRRTPKIAFMFLIQNSQIPFAPLWNKFFKGHEDLYNVYVHMWPLKISAMQKTSGAFWGRVIPSQEGKKQTPGLIANARRLLANALLDDPSNEWFAVISESCIPIHGFRHVYKTLFYTNKSFLQSSTKHWDMQNRYKARGDNVMKPEIKFSQFRTGSQFWVMRRRHAVMTVGDTKYWNKFDQPCLPKLINCYPEEHYFPTLMGILDPNGMNNTATLVDWSRMQPGGHPRKFVASEISLSLIRDMQEKANGQFLFARKFDPSCLDPLLAIANATFAY